MITEQGARGAIKRVCNRTSKSVELRDPAERGVGRLTLLVRPNDDGASTEWYAVWYRGGRRKKAKMGAYPALAIVDARKLFRETFAPAISVGKDPVSNAARRRISDKTVLALFQAYVEHLTNTGKANASAVSYALLGPKRGHGGAARSIGEAMLAADVKPSDITPVLRAVHDRGAESMAVSLRSYIHAAFGFGMRSLHDYASTAGGIDWGVTVNPVAAIPANTEANKAGQRYLRPAEFRLFWNWLETKDENHIAAPATRLCMSVGQRLIEVVQLIDPSYDRAEAILDWSKTKNGSQHAIPLPRRAVLILNSMVPNRHGLFFPSMPNSSTGTKYGAMAYLIDDFIDETGTEPFTARDLRRTWKTLAGAAGISKDIRDRIQNHAKGDVSSRHYDRYEYMAEKRAGMAQWSAYLDRILIGEIDNIVTPLRSVS